MKRENIAGMLPFYLLALIIFVCTASWGSKAVSAAVQNSPIHREYTIVIDAGHGGIDGGATSCTGVLESAINLQIALKLNDLLHLLGYDTVMIRTTDTSIYTQGSTIAAQKVSDLKERVRIVNETEKAILISIHQNTFSSPRYSGAQVFYADTPGSRELAQQLQSKLCPQRSIKSSGSIYLLQNIRKTGVLIECGFLSNPEEEAKLRQHTYQQYLCGVIASTLCELFNCDG